MSDTVTIPIPANTWTEVATGPIEVQITGSDNFEYAEAASVGTVDADVDGHNQFALRPLPWVLDEGQGLYVRNRHRPFRISKNEADL